MGRTGSGAVDSVRIRFFRHENVLKHCERQKGRWRPSPSLLNTNFVGTTGIIGILNIRHVQRVSRSLVSRFF